MKTTKKDFELFKEEFMKYFYYYGLQSMWRVYFELKKCQNKDADAEIITDFNSRNAFVRLNTEVSYREILPEAAFHEAMELRYARVREFAERDNPSWEEVSTYIHELIAQDTNLVFDKKEE